MVVDRRVVGGHLVVLLNVLCLLGASLVVKVIHISVFSVCPETAPSVWDKATTHFLAFRSRRVRDKMATQL